VPVWVVLLDMANGDPLRAAQIEDELTQEWWERAVVYRSELAQAQKEMEKHGKRKT